MSFLTEHCSAVIIQGLFFAATFEHQLHSSLFPGARSSAHLWSRWVERAIRWVAEPIVQTTPQICCLHYFNSRRVTGRLQQKTGMGKITQLMIQRQNSPLQKICMHYLSGRLALLLCDHSALIFWLLFYKSAEKWETRWCSRGDVWESGQKAI